jgi:ABC-type multidrug transport system permease subunit
MTGLLSEKPSPGSVRLVVGGFVLMFVQTYLLMLVPGIATHLRMIVWIVTFVSGASFIGALVGLPDPPSTHWRRRNGR